MGEQIKVKSYRGIWILIVFSAVIAWQRVHWSALPLDRDASVYTLIAQELLSARALYSDLWDHKPPGVHLSLAAIQWFGVSALDSILYCSALSIALGLVGIYICLISLGASTLAIFWGAAFWSILCSNYSLEAATLNTENFANLIFITGLACLLGAKNSCSKKRLFLIAFLFALTSLYKQILILIPLGTLLARMLSAYSKTEQSKVMARQSLLLILLTLTQAALMWFLLALYFYMQGHWSEFYSAVFEYNRFYAGNIAANLLKSFEPNSLLPRLLRYLLPLILLSLLGILVGLRSEQRKTWIMFIGAIVSTYLVVALSGKFYKHYYQLWFPLIVLAVSSLVSQSRLIRQRVMRYSMHLFVVLVYLGILWHEIPYYKANPKLLSDRTHVTKYLQAENLGLYLRQLLEAHELFYHWGAEPSLYLYSNKKPPTGVFYSHALNAGPLTQELSARVIKDLEQHTPELVVINRLTLKESPLDSKVLHWIAPRYAPCPALGTYGQYYLHCLKGGRLLPQ